MVAGLERGCKLLFFWGDTKIVFTPTGKTALPGKDIMDTDL